MFSNERLAEAAIKGHKSSAFFQGHTLDVVQIII